MTDSALVGASVDAMVGITTTGSFRYQATALAVSSVSPTQSDHAPAAMLFDKGHQAFYFRPAALPVKAFGMAGHTVAGKAGQDLIARQFHHNVIGNHKKMICQVLAYSPKDNKASGP